MKTSEQKFQLRTRKRRGRTAAEINCLGRYGEGGALLVEIAQNSLTKSRCLRTIEQVFVKRTIRADPRAKGDVNIDMVDHSLNLAYPKLRGRGPALRSG